MDIWIHPDRYTGYLNTPMDYPQISLDYGIIQTGYGTTQVGCRGGSRYSEGYHKVSWKSERFSNFTVQKYQDSTPIQNCSKSTEVFQSYFDLVGFTYVLRFSDIQNLSRFHHRRILWKCSEKPMVLDWPALKKQTKIRSAFFMSGSVICLGNLVFPKCWDVKNNMF